MTHRVVSEDHRILKVLMRPTILTRFFFAVALAGVTSSGVSAQQTLQGLESENQFQQALAAVDAVKHRKKMTCMLSAINAALCQCLSENLPIGTYLRSYPAIANKQGEYTQLPASNKTVVDRCIDGNR
jgi:hypothetical protein